MGLANKVTIARILLAPFFLACFLYYSPEKDFLRYIALAIFCVSALTDAIDGYIARRFYEKTRLGRIIDPLADKFLILAAYTSLSTIGNIPLTLRIPVWLTIVVLSRDLFIIVGASIIFVLTKKMDFKPLLIGKITTSFQMLAVILVLLQLGVGNLLWWTTALFTILSGVGYLLRESKDLNGSY